MAAKKAGVGNNAETRKRALQNWMPLHQPAFMCISQCVPEIARRLCPYVTFRSPLSTNSGRSVAGSLRS
jgi:hypothetical protein